MLIKAQSRRNEKLRVKHRASVPRRSRASEARAARGTPLTQRQGVCSSGVHCHARPAPVPIRCAQARPHGARATAALAYRPCYLRNCIPPITGAIRISLVLGAQRGECKKRGRQRALQAGRASRRRKRASLYQPVVRRIANKVAAAVLLSVNRVGQRTTEHRAAPRQTISKRSNVAGVTEGEGLEKVATPRLGWEKIPLRI